MDRNPWGVLILVAGIVIYWKVHRAIEAFGVAWNISPDAAGSVLGWGCLGIVLLAVGLFTGVFIRMLAFVPAMGFWSITPALDDWSQHGVFPGVVAENQAWYGSGWFQVPVLLVLLGFGLWFEWQRADRY